MWHYFTAVANQELESDMDGGGGAGCTETCCLEYQACLVNASSTYRINFLLWR